MKVKFKRTHPAAVVPSYAKDGDAGMDLTAVDIKVNPDYQYVEYDTGIAVEIPEGHVGLLFPLSSISKTNLDLCNSVGVVDSGYRGSIKLRFNVLENKSSVEYLPQDKVGQLVIIPYPKVELEEVNELVSSDRGEGGFGHTGR